MVIAEVRLAGPRSDDQAVIRGFVTVAEQLRDDEFALQVDVRDIAEQNLNVVLTPQDHPRWRSDRAFGDDAGRHLVEHRLEQVMGGTSDQLDVDVGPFELLDRVQTTESRSDDHDPVSTMWHGVYGLGAHGLDRSSAAAAFNYTLAARTWFNRVISPTQVIERDGPRYPVRDRPADAARSPATKVCPARRRRLPPRSPGCRCSSPPALPAT